jgi:hypothetical protein
MLTIFTMLSGVATMVSEPIAYRATEMPELASMALLSVVLAGVSVAVRRTGPKAGGDASRKAPGDANKP